MAWFDTPYNLTVGDCLNNGLTAADLGLGDYPIFDEAHRSTLNDLILTTYRNYKLGYETPALFKKMMANRMNLIMPYYNEIYLTKAALINPLYTTDITETLTAKDSKLLNGSDKNTGTTKDENATNGSATTTINGKTSGSTSGTSNETGTNEHRNFTLPQASGNADGTLSDSYADTASKDTTGNNTTSSSTNSTTDNSTTGVTSNGTDNTTHTLDTTLTKNEQVDGTNEYTKILRGYQGSNITELVLKWRSAIINIDEKIVEDPKIVEMFGFLF